jgi:uncharacterized protein YecE (DUF72 family)
MVCHGARSLLFSGDEGPRMQEMNARSMPLIGCCGWAGSQPQYFSQFPVIEIQSTFYDPPASKVAARWRTFAPAEFEFCIKAWQLITHAPSNPTYRRLRHPIDDERSGFCGSFQDTDEVWQAWIKTREIAEAVNFSSARRRSRRVAPTSGIFPASFRRSGRNHSTSRGSLADRGKLKSFAIFARNSA